jgi:hypothetical protein
VQTTVITDEALLHTDCPPDKLLQHTSVGKLSYSRSLEFQFVNSHHCQQPVFLICHECMVERLNHFH